MEPGPAFRIESHDSLGPSWIADRGEFFAVVERAEQWRGPSAGKRNTETLERSSDQ
jgi:hypothetical protein